MTRRSRLGSRPMQLQLCGAAACSILLAIVAFMLPAAASQPGAPALRLHQVAAAVLAAHATFIDGILWPCLFRTAIRRRRQEQGLLGSDKDRRPSINEVDVDEDDSCCSRAWCRRRPRLLAMYTNSDWNSVWIGFFTLIPIIVSAAFGADENDVPVPRGWERNPLQSIVSAMPPYNSSDVLQWPYKGGFLGDWSGAGFFGGLISLLGVLVTLLIPLGFSSAACAGGPRAVLPPFVFLWFMVRALRWLCGHSGPR
jgi:hypothetical protein